MNEYLFPLQISMNVKQLIPVMTMECAQTLQAVTPVLAQKATRVMGEKVAAVALPRTLSSR